MENSEILECVNEPFVNIFSHITFLVVISTCTMLR